MLALSGAGTGCADGPEDAVPRGACGGSIALSGDRLWVASPDDDSLVALDPDSLVELARVALGETPVAFVLDGAAAWVTTSSSRDLLRVELATGAVSRVATGCAGTGEVCTLEGGAWSAVASCPAGAALVAILPGGAVERLALGPRPSGLDVDAGRLRVGLAGGRIVELDLPTRAAPITQAAPRVVFEPSAPPGTTFGPVRGLVRGGTVGVSERLENDDRSRPPERGSYGDVFDDAPRIEPRVLGADCAGSYARFDGGSQVFSGPRDAAWDEAAQRLWVVHRHTRNVAVLDCATGAPAVVGAVPVGHGAAGIALSGDGAVAWVDNAFDRSVTRVEFDGARVSARTLVRDTTGSRWSPRAEAGRRIFHDAQDPHLTPSGVVACATCHPDGGEDGLTWFVHTHGVPAKVRRTPPAWSTSLHGRSLHWDAEFASAESLFRATVVELLGGDGLLLDAAAVAAYMAEIPPPPRGDADARGAAVFERAGCAACHAGAAGSDGLVHAVAEPLGDPLVDLPGGARTPTLIGVSGRAPFLHDGRAATLGELLTEHNPRDAHGRTSDLGPDELAALIRHLESL